MSATDSDALLVLNSFAGASVAAVNELKSAIPSRRMRRAARMIEAADRVVVAALNDARPVALYLTEGLGKLRRRCLLLHALDSDDIQQVRGMTEDEVLVVIGFGSDAERLASLLSVAAGRAVHVLGITNHPGNPIALEAQLAIVLENSSGERVQPLAPFVVLVEALISTTTEGPAQCMAGVRESD